MTDKRYQIGICVTALYLAALVIYALVQRDAVLGMEPNEFGDALAGAASPLAFLWLVLGYLQQGDELRQNTEALRLQASELKNSVLQQEQLVRATREQIESEREMAFDQQFPRFELSTSRFADDEFSASAHLTAKNVGKEAYEVNLVTVFPSASHEYQLGMAPKFSERQCLIEHLEEPPCPCDVTLLFKVQFSGGAGIYKIAYQASYVEEADGLLWLRVGSQRPSIELDMS